MRANNRPKATVHPLSLIFIGLIIGLIGSLYYAWVIDPISYVDASPARLNPTAKKEYIFLVSQSYALNQNWDEAVHRLRLLQDPDLTETVSDQLEEMVKQGGTGDAYYQTVRNIAALAKQLGVNSTAVSLLFPREATAVPTANPNLIPATATPTLLPTPTKPSPATPILRPTLPHTPTPIPSPTVPPAYRLLYQDPICEADKAAPRLELITLNPFLEQLPGVKIDIRWENGKNQFYTGFKPNYGPGYADFQMQPDQSYTVWISEGSPEVSGIRLTECAETGFVGGWRLTFQRLILEE